MTMKWSKELRVSQTIPDAVHCVVISGAAPLPLVHLASPFAPPSVNPVLQFEVHFILSPSSSQPTNSIDSVASVISLVRATTVQVSEKDFIVIILTITNMNTVPTGVKQFNLLPRVQPRLPWAMKLF